MGLTNQKITVDISTETYKRFMEWVDGLPAREDSLVEEALNQYFNTLESAARITNTRRLRA